MNRKVGGNITMYTASEKRYETMQYNRCGSSGLKLPAVSLGLWHNFGSNASFDNMQSMCYTAFDILTLQTIMDPSMGLRRKTSDAFWRKDLASIGTSW